MKQTLLQSLITASSYLLVGMFMQTLLTGLLWASEVEAQAQSVREVYVVLKINPNTVAEVMQLVESETDYDFSYYPAEINLDKPISLTPRRTSVYDLLVDVSAQTGLSFRQINNVINVKNKERLQQTGKVEIVKIALNVSGQVSDTQGELLPGVNVLVKGSSIGTVTDVEGRYSLEVPNEDDILVFSSIGYTTQEVPVNGRTAIDVALAEDVLSLEEVVVVGYGEQRKKEVTGAVGSVNSEDFIQGNVGDAAQLIQGKVAGLTVATPSGDPTDNSQILLRGTSTLATSTQPLILVDGIPGNLNFP